MTRGAKPLFALGLIVAMPVVAKDVVGTFIDTRGVFHGFLLHEGAFTAIDLPGVTATLAFGINPRRDIAGWYINTGGVNHRRWLHSRIPSAEIAGIWANQENSRLESIFASTLSQQHDSDRHTLAHK